MRSLTLALAVLLVLPAAASDAQEAIGKATSIKPQADGSHSGTLSAGSTVYSKETVRTGGSGQADLRFHDSSNLSSCMTRINQRAQLLSRRHAARFDL